MTNQNPSVFIAYGEADKNLMESVQAAVASLLNLNHKQEIKRAIYTFSQSDAPDWLVGNARALATAQVLLVLLTPNSLYSPWIHWEIGGKWVIASARDRSRQNRAAKGPRVVIGLAGGLRKNGLPEDVSRFYDAFRANLHELSDSQGALGFTRAISTALGQGASCLSRETHRIVEAAHGFPGWGVVSRCDIATAIRESPFKSLEHFKTRETMEIMDVAPNLYSMWGNPAPGPECRRELAKRLRTDRQFRMTVVICDREYCHFTRSWVSLVGDSYVSHLNEVMTNLVRFWKRIRKRSGGGGATPMEVYAVRVMPISFTFIKKRDGTEVLFIKPHISRESNDRPIFCLSGANPGHLGAIRYYSAKVKHLLTLGEFTKKLRMVKGRPVFVSVGNPL